MEYLRSIFPLLTLLLLTSCAQQRTPTGGVRDTTGPEVIDAAPPPMSTGFSSDRIEIEFDEYVKLQGVRDQVLISPPLIEPPVIELKGAKRLIIDFGAEELRPNTTYTINLGEAVKDNNEGNPLKENVYLFSTGTYIDTLELRGQLLRARYNTACDGCLALLFPDVEDSLVLGERPYYIARADEQGMFVISNLAEGDYRLFALDDLDADLRIDPNETMGFVDEILNPVALDSAQRIVRLSSPEAPFRGVKDRSWSEDGRRLTLVTQGLDSVPHVPVSLYDRLLYVERLDGREDSVRYWFDRSLEDLDELVLDLHGDMDTLSVGRARDTAPMTALEISADLANAEEPLRIRLARPLGSLELEAISITKDSLPVDWSLSDSVETAMRIDLLGDWEPGTMYEVLIEPGAIEDVYGQTNDSLLTSVLCPGDKTFATLTFVMDVEEDGGVYYAELLDRSNKVLFEKQLSGADRWTIEFLKPGNYGLRVFVDENENGIWDKGNFEDKIQPEPVFMLVEPINAKANWEVEQEIKVEFD